MLRWVVPSARFASRTLALSFSGSDGWRSRVEAGGCKHPNTLGRYAGQVLQPPSLPPPLGQSWFHLPRPRVGMCTVISGPPPRWLRSAFRRCWSAGPTECALSRPTQCLEVIRHVHFQLSRPLHGRGCLRACEGPAAQHPETRALLTHHVVVCTLPSPPGHTSRLKPLVLEVLKRSIKICGSDI